MQKDKLINVALFLLSFAFIYMIAYPMYAGSGYNVLGKSNIMFEYAKNRELKNLQAVAIDLKDNGVNQSTAYANVDKYKKSRIETALPSKIDIARVINDIDKMAEKSNVKLSDIKFTKIANNKKFSELNIYNIGFTMSGDYLNFKSFLSTIEKSLELYNIKNLTISKKDSAENEYTYTVTLEAFELK